MVIKTENVDPLRTITQETVTQRSALEGGPSPTVVLPKKTLSRVAQSIVRRLLGLYALRRPLSVLILVFVDTLALFAGFGLSSYLMGGDGWPERVLHLAPILLTIWLTIFAAHRLYDRASSRRSPVGLLGAVLLLVALFSHAASPTRHALSRCARPPARPRHGSARAW